MQRSNCGLSTGSGPMHGNFTCPDYFYGGLVVTTCVLSKCLSVDSICRQLIDVNIFGDTFMIYPYPLDDSNEIIFI